MIRELLAKPAFQELSDSLKQYTSFDIQQLPSIFGDKMLGAVVFNKEADPDIDLVLSLPIRDLQGYRKLQSELGRIIDSIKKTDSSDFAKKFRAVVKDNGKMMVLSLSEKTAGNFLSNKGVQPLPAHLREYAKYPMMLNLDLPELIRTVMMKEVQKTAPEELTFLNNLKDIRVYGGEYREGATLMTAEINFSDPNQNSLAQIFGIMNEAVAMMTRNKDAGEEYEPGMEDTVAVENELSYLRYMIPELKDPKAQDFLEKYTDVVIDYIKTLPDSAINTEAKKNYLLWEERARIFGKDIKDKDDSEKFNEFILVLKNYVENED
jgi:hypothetical protein